jgi:hypothetical protein
VLSVIAPAAALAMLAAGASAQRPGTAPPGDPTSTTVPAGTTPATSSTVAASGEDTGLGPEVSTPQGAPSISAPQVQSAPIVAVPAGCPTPAATTAVFFGKVDKMDFRTAQFTVTSIRAGSLDGFAVGNQVQVRYGDDVRFLDVGTSYIVGATPDAATGVLVSKVREATPLFGGDAVAGADDSDVKCPTVEDPVMTLTTAATQIDTGLLTPLRSAKSDLLLAILRPLVVALAILIGLVLLKQLAFATGRSLRSNTVTERTVVRVSRRRPRPTRPGRPTTRRVTRRAGRAGPGQFVPAPPDELVHSGAGNTDGSGEAGA